MLQYLLDRDAENKRLKKQGLAPGQGLTSSVNEFALRAGNEFALRVGSTGGGPQDHLNSQMAHKPHRLSQDEAEEDVHGTYANALALAAAQGHGLGPAQGHGLAHHRSPTAAAAAAAAAAAVAMRDEGAILRRAERARERALRGPRTKGDPPCVCS